MALSHDNPKTGQLCFHLAEYKKEGQPPFLFLATYAYQKDPKSSIQFRPLGLALRDHLKEETDEFDRLTAPLRAAAEDSEFLRAMLRDDKIYKPCPFTEEDVYYFLRAAEHFEKNSIKVRVPDSWKNGKPSKPKISIEMIDPEDQPSTVGLGSMMSFDVNITLDGKRLSEKEITQLLAAKSKIFNIDGRWIEVDAKKVGAILDTWQNARRQFGTISIGHALKMMAKINTPSEEADEAPSDAMSYTEVIPNRLTSDILRYLAAPPEALDGDVKSILQDKLNANLRAYQNAGLNWLLKSYENDLGGCLADDMGLGKTIQVISLLLVIHQRKVDPTLLILPASLIGNWQNELSKFAPSLRFKTLHRSETIESRATEDDYANHRTDILLCTYESFQNTSWVLNLDWGLQIIDEAQAIKNSDSKRTKAVKKIKSKHRLALTGTPIENSLMDLWSIFDYTSRPLLGDQKEFAKNKSDDPKFQEKLRNLTKPFILRRKKSDPQIAPDLPEKIERKIYCPLSEDQILLYRHHTNQLKEDLVASKDNPKKKNGLVLSYLTKFKQICNHPNQLLGGSEFDFEQSGKFVELIRLAKKIQELDEKLVVFTQFTSIARELNKLLSRAFEKDGFILDGSTPIPLRKELVSSFQKKDGPPFFILSLKAGGTGLNLTEANHVVHFDRWWNPAIENQATDRAFRIGQKKNVLVHKFIARGTIEDRIDQLLEEKARLSENILDGEAWVNFASYSDQELLDLISL